MRVGVGVGVGLGLGVGGGVGVGVGVEGGWELGGRGVGEGAEGWGGWRGVEGWSPGGGFSPNWWLPNLVIDQIPSNKITLLRIMAHTTFDDCQKSHFWKKNLHIVQEHVLISKIYVPTNNLFQVQAFHGRLFSSGKELCCALPLESVHKIYWDNSPCCVFFQYRSLWSRQQTSWVPAKNYHIALCYTGHMISTNRYTSICRSDYNQYSYD